MSLQTARANSDRPSSSVGPVLAVFGYIAAILVAIAWAVCLLSLPVLAAVLMLRELLNG